MHRLLPGALEAHQPARRVHHHDRPARIEPEPRLAVAKDLGKRAEIGLHHRPQIGVEHRRAGAFVFAELQAEIGRDADRHAREFPLQDCPGPRRRADIRLRERLDLLARRSHPPPRGGAEVAGDKLFGPRRGDVEEGRPVLAPDRRAEVDPRLPEDPVEALDRLVTFTLQYYVDNPDFLILVGIENLNGGAYLRGIGQEARCLEHAPGKEAGSSGAVPCRQALFAA